MSDHQPPAIPQERVDSVAAIVWDIEAHMDRALVLFGDLTRNLVQAQSEGGLSPIYLHKDVFSKLAPLFSGLTEGRSAVVDLHLGLGAAGKRLGLEVRSDSPPGHKEDSVPWPFGEARVAEARGAVVALERRSA